MSTEGRLSERCQMARDSETGAIYLFRPLWLTARLALPHREVS